MTSDIPSPGRIVILGLDTRPAGRADPYPGDKEACAVSGRVRAAHADACKAPPDHRALLNPYRARTASVPSKVSR